jgi:hypothetical protein
MQKVLLKELKNSSKRAQKELKKSSKRAQIKSS